MTSRTGRPAGEETLSAKAKEALRHLEIVARRVVDGMRHGIHSSRRIGVSTEFDHHKLYMPGDPLKHIDWKVSARHEKYYVKRYLEDTSLAVRIVVDRSASMLQRTEDCPSKYERACQIAACMAYLILKQKDAVGLALASEDGTAWLPDSSTQAHLVRILEMLVARPAAGTDRLDRCLRSVLERGGRRGMVVLISDLLYPPDAVQRELASLQSQGHEVIVFRVLDRTEEEFPFNRWVDFRDLENPGTRRRIDTVPLRQLYLEEYEAVGEEWRTWARKHDVHVVNIRAEERLETILSEYLARRSGVRV